MSVERNLSGPLFWCSGGAAEEMVPGDGSAKVGSRPNCCDLAILAKEASIHERRPDAVGFGDLQSIQCRTFLAVICSTGACGALTGAVFLRGGLPDLRERTASRAAG